jgi:pimeloyl-ACP methyl ester carboxylesterase
MILKLDDGSLVNCVSFGVGPQTVIAHGAGPAGWEAWQLPLELWSASGWRAISYDHRGSGSTTCDVESITAANLADDMIRVMDAVGADRCYLAGESMGGVVAMLAAERHPDRVEGLLLATTAPRVTERAEALASGWEKDLEGFTKWFVEASMPEHDSSHLKDWATDLFLRGRVHQGHRVLRAMIAGPDPELGSITAPAIVIAAERM